MIPSLIVAAAQMAGLDLIAIADHNSCENAGAVMRVAEGTGLKVLPGLEVQSVEGIHFLCLFSLLEDANKMQEIVYQSLPKVKMPEKDIEQQIIVDSNDNFIRFCEIPLSLPTMMDVDEVYARASDIGGVVIPSHIDRRSSGICGVLGMIPESPCYQAVEISANTTPDEARFDHPEIGSRPILTNSDAHWLSAIGEHWTQLYMKHRTLQELRLAFRGEGGRRVVNA